MDFYWVNIGDSHKEVAHGKYLWAPSHGVDKNRKMFTNAGWKNVPIVKAGDIIFCHLNGYLTSVGVAHGDAFESQRPAGLVDWVNNGWRIDLHLTELNPPVDVHQFKQTIIQLHNGYCVPALFDKNGKLSQQYMIALPKSAGALIMNFTGEAEIEVDDESSKRSGKTKLTKGGSRPVVTSSRIGQGQFRDGVLALWGNSCPVTKIQKKDLLIASHMVPWTIADDYEKIDPHNGIALSPTVDKLFGSGYISFDQNGLMLISPAITIAELTQLGIKVPTIISPLNGGQRTFLARHREIFHFQ